MPYCIWILIISVNSTGFWEGKVPTSFLRNSGEGLPDSSMKMIWLQLNSDEFSVLLTKTTHHKSEIKDLIKCLHEEMSCPFIIDDTCVTLTFSAGIMYMNNTSESAQSAIKNLKAAAQKVKEKGGNGYML